jgi:hypothetical protein
MSKPLFETYTTQNPDFIEIPILQKHDSMLSALSSLKINQFETHQDAHDIFQFDREEQDRFEDNFLQEAFQEELKQNFFTNEFPQKQENSQKNFFNLKEFPSA